MSRRRTATVALAALAATAAAVAPAFASAGGSAHASSSHIVVLKDLRFHPSALTIQHGESVTWQWRDGEKHNVTFHGFHSRTLKSGSYTVRFLAKGTFNYRCTIHEAEGMRGKIIVH